MDEKRRGEIKRFLKTLDHTPDGAESAEMYATIYELLDEINRLEKRMDEMVDPPYPCCSE